MKAKNFVDKNVLREAKGDIIVNPQLFLNFLVVLFCEGQNINESVFYLLLLPNSLNAVCNWKLGITSNLKLRWTLKLLKEIFFFEKEIRSKWKNKLDKKNRKKKMKKAHSQFNNLSKVNIPGVSKLAIGGIALFIKKKR